MKQINTCMVVLFLAPTLLSGYSFRALAQSNESPGKYSVIIFDLSKEQEEDSETRVDGFPTYELAKEFVKRRVRDSLEELRKPDQSKDELKRLWLIYGESAVVIDDDKKYDVKSEIDYFIEHPATPDERDWKAIKKKAGIK